MNFLSTNFKGLYIVEPQIICDDRGWFMRTFSKDQFECKIGDYKCDWVQMNHSFSKEAGTWRGFHFQEPPFQETKLIRCISGRVLDYVLDLRKGSKTFLKVFEIELSSLNKKMLFIPKGFAHGFCTLEANSELLYLHDVYYNPKFEKGVKYDDPAINLILPVKPTNLSIRDLNHKLLNNNFKGY